MLDSTVEEPPIENKQKRFGTISGVFMTDILTIFSVILFYKEGWLVGNTGLLGAIIIITVAHTITVATTLSVSSIVTNIQIKGGGPYYLISRSLGPEIGGTIGVAFYFAQTFSISFNIIGFTMSLQGFLTQLGIPEIPIVLLNLLSLSLIVLLAFVSANIAIKAQFIIFALVMLALISFFAGNMRFDVVPTLFGSFGQAGFWKSFAIFFPAATGIMAGLALSGDLKNPEKNIPRGTIGAVLFAFTTYILVAIFFAFNVPMEKLLHNPNIMIESSIVPMVVILGVWAATLSTALGAILGSPRTMQAMANDNVLPKILGWGSKKNNEPRIAIIISAIFAEGLLLVGDIEFVAQLLTMFFLSTYGFLNLISAVEQIVGNPSYRPKFKVHWSVSLYGALGSFTVMFLFNQIATIAAIVIIGIIYYLLTKRTFESKWGDIRKGFWASIIEIAMANYEKFQSHPRNWRPYIAIIENHTLARNRLIEFANWVNTKKGIISHYVYIHDTLHNAIEQKDRELESIRNLVKENGYTAIYPEIIFTMKDKNAPIIALQADGIASFKANTILSDFSVSDTSLENQLRHLHDYQMLQKNVMLLKLDYNMPSEDLTEKEDRIDVWISGFQGNISMMLLIPYLLTKNPEWSSTKIVLRMVVRTEEMRKKSLENLKSILKYSRIDAEIDIQSLGAISEGAVKVEEIKSDKWMDRFMNKLKALNRLNSYMQNLEQAKYEADERETIRNIIQRSSKNARLVVMGLSVPQTGKEHESAQSLNALLKELPVTVLVKSNQVINLFL